MTNSERLVKLDAAMTTLPTFTCNPGCHDCCGPVVMSRLEWQRICDQLGETPGPRADLTCPMLGPEGCRVYAIRPAVCHLYGVVRGALECPHVKPERMISNQEARVLLGKVQRLGA